MKNSSYQLQHMFIFPCILLASHISVIDHCIDCRQFGFQYSIYISSMELIMAEQTSSEYKEDVAEVSCYDT